MGNNLQKKKSDITNIKVFFDGRYSLKKPFLFVRFQDKHVQHNSRNCYSSDNNNYIEFLH